MRTVIRRTIVMAAVMASLTALTPTAASAQTTGTPDEICVYVLIRWVCVEY